MEDLTKHFVTCSRLSWLFKLTQSVIRKLTPTIDTILFGGILMISQLVLVLIIMLDTWATGFLHRTKMQLYIVDSTKIRSSETHCVVTLFIAKVISRVNVEASYQNTLCNFVEKCNAYNESV